MSTLDTLTNRETIYDFNGLTLAGKKTMGKVTFKGSLFIKQGSHTFTVTNIAMEGGCYDADTPILYQAVQ